MESWWRKSILIGVGAGVTLAVLGIAVVAVSVWWTSRERAWDTSSVSVTSVTAAAQYFSHDFQSNGFVFEFSARNNTGRDVTIRPSSQIMKRLSDDNALEALSNMKLSREGFIPASQMARLSISIEWSCKEIDANGKATERDPKICYSDFVSGAKGFVLFDSEHRIQIEIPVPTMR